MSIQLMVEDLHYAGKENDCCPFKVPFLTLSALESTCRYLWKLTEGKHQDSHVRRSAQITLRVHPFCSAELCRHAVPGTVCSTDA